MAGLLVLIALSFDTGATDAAESSPDPMTQPQKPELVVQTGHQSVRAVAFSPDGKLVATGGGGTLKLWEVASGRELRTLSHATWAEAVAFSPDGKLVATAGWDKTAKLWEVASGRELRTLTGHTSRVNAVAFSPDGKVVATASGDRTAKLWEVASGRELRTLAHATSVEAVAFSPDGKVVATGVWLLVDRYLGGLVERLRDDTVKLWDVASGRELYTLAGHKPGLFTAASLAFSPDGTLLATAGRDGTAKLWEVASGRELRTLTGHGFQVQAVAFSPDGKVVATGSGSLVDQPLRDKSHPVTLWEVASGRELRTLANTNNASSVAFSPDGTLVATAGGGDLKLWDMASGRELHTLNVTVVNQNVLNSVDFKGDGTLVASGSWDKTTKLFWEAAGWHMHTLVGNRYGWAFSPDGKVAAPGGGSMSGTVWLWEAASGRELRTLAGHTERVTSVAFSPDGKLLATGSRDDTAKLWEVASGRELRALAHSYVVEAVAFSPNGTVVATYGLDKLIKLWDAQSGNEVATWFPFEGGNYVVATPDYYYLASKGGLQGVAFRMGLRAYPFEQFDLRLNRPDIVIERLGSAPPETIASYRKARQKRLRKMGFSEDMLKPDFHIPEVVIASQGIPISTAEQALSFTVKATDSKYELDRLNVYVNDVPLYGIEGIPLRSKKTQSIEQDIRVALANGKNKIQVSALNVQGAESLKQTYTVTYSGPQKKPDAYLVAIGVSSYQNAKYNLKYAAKDATDLTSSYRERLSGSGKYGNVHVLTITDDQATKANILKAKELLKKTQVDDLAVVFLAGHGLTDEKEENYFFGAHDVNFKKPQEGGVPYEEIDNLLDRIPALQKLLLIDTCFSGEIDKTETEVLVAEAASPQSDGGQVKVRAFTDKRGVRAAQRLTAGKLTFQEEFFADLRRGTGAVVISSSSGDEYSYETETVKNGVFTYAVLKGLKDFAADKNKDKTIRVSELQEYVLKEVPAMTLNRQNPTVRRENLENDFVLY
jgi:WD40 repeat protein